MIAVAAIDLMGGRAVQLVQGDPDRVEVDAPDPAAIARAWSRTGFSRLHVVDLDAALSRGDNREQVEELLEAVDLPVQVGGGIRADADAAAWLQAGADRVIVGTRAVEDPGWGVALATRWPGRIVLAADVRNGEVATHGWRAGSGSGLEALLQEYADAPLAGVLVTDVSREGRQAGCDLTLFGNAVAASPHPLIAAGSITTASDLKGLAAIGVAEAVLGMALYSGTLRPEAIRPWLGAPNSDSEEST